MLFYDMEIKRTLEEKKPAPRPSFRQNSWEDL